MGDICTKEYHWLIEYLGSDGGQQNTVHSTQLHINFETKIGQCLWASLIDILCLNTLSSHTKYCITDP